MQRERVCLCSALVLALATWAFGETVSLNALPGSGAGAINWTAGGATVGDDAAAAGGTASTFTGRQPNRRVAVPIADTTFDSTYTIYAVTVRVSVRSDVDLSGTYDGMKIMLSTGGSDFTDPAIDEVGMAYSYYEHTWDVNPATLIPWTWADIVALEAGAITAKSQRPTDMTLFLDFVEVVVTYSNNNTPPVASNVDLTGVLTVGDTVTGSYDYTDSEGDPEGTSTYKWYRADDAVGTNKAAMSGQTGQTCQIPLTAEGKYIYFEVTPVAQTGVTTGLPVESGAFGPIAPAVGSPPTATNVLITGIDTVGATLFGTYSYSDPDGDLEGISTFRWIRDGFVIPGASATTYTLTVADETATISFEVVPVAATGTPTVGAAAGSPAFGPIAAATGLPPEALNVSISGIDSVGSPLLGTYTYNDSDSDVEGVSTFRWLRDGVPIAGATDTVYTLVVADEGASISFEVTPVALSGTPSRGTPTASAALGPIAPAIGSAPTADSVTINGTARVGDTLTGSYVYGDVDGDVEGVSTYQWDRDSVPIAGATDLTYVLTPADAGAMISLEVTPVAATGWPKSGAPAANAQVGPVDVLVPVLVRSGIVQRIPSHSSAHIYNLRGQSVGQVLRLRMHAARLDQTVSGLASGMYLIRPGGATTSAVPRSTKRMVGN